MATGDPTGADLASGTTNGNTLPEYGTSWEEREVSLGAGTALTSGTKYAIVVRAASSDLYWSKRIDNPTANGDLYESSDSGSSWTIETDDDCWFKTKASSVEKDDGSFAVDDFNRAETMGGADWGAQTFTAGSSYTIDAVVLKLGRWPAATPGIVTVGIRATVGVPEKATTPVPANVATNVTLDQATLTWVDGGGADTFDVYYGTQSGNLTKVSTAQAGTSFTVTGITNGSPYAYLSTRYWRIDSTNNAGTTTGDEWSFTTIRLSAPTPTYWYSVGSYYYRLLIQADGSYGDSPADGGVENTDYEVLAGYLPNFINTTRRLVGVANNKVWYEDI